MQKENSTTGKLYTITPESQFPERLAVLCTKLLFPLILFFYPMRHIWFGVEWWDTGYNYGNFMYMDHMDTMWVFSTYLGNALGNLMTKLPFGGTMMGMNFYTGLTVSFLALMGYYFFTVKAKLPAWAAFAGEFLAVSLCWCPTALLYNYLTYLLFAAGVVSLYCALTEDKRSLFVLAGIFLGINVFVRFPNLAQMALIVGVWAYGIICRTKIKKVAAQTGWCILGYGIGAGACLGFLAVRYGLDAYVDGITRLLSMPSGASDYTLYSMIYGQVTNYLENLKWLGILFVFVLVGVAVTSLLPSKSSRLRQVVSAALTAAGIIFLYNKRMFVKEYTSTRSVFHWAVFLLTATLVMGIITIFRKKASNQDKLQMGFCILIILITPLGSNNHLYSSINNLFLVAPASLWMLLRFLQWLPQEIAPGSSHIKLSLIPVKIMITGLLLMLAFQSLCFGYTYVFTESNGGENLHTKIENNDILKGMYTDPEHAEIIEEISIFVKEQGLQGQEVILYGQIPAVSYYLQMPFAITSWPDLRSYHISVMEKDLKRVEEEAAAGGRTLPLMILDKKFGLYLEGGRKALAEAGYTEAVITELEKDAKFQLLLDWAQKYHYKVWFENEKLVLLQAITAG